MTLGHITPPPAQPHPLLAGPVSLNVHPPFQRPVRFPSRKNDSFTRHGTKRVSDQSIKAIHNSGSV